MFNYESYNKSLILLQIEAFKYIIRPMFSRNLS